jgi:hypothetical protein
MRITDRKTDIKGNTTEISFEFNKKVVTRKVKKGVLTYKKEQYFIFDSEQVEKIPTRLNVLGGGWSNYERELEEVVNHYKDYQEKETVGRPNGNGHMSVYNGDIMVRKDHTIHGGTYGFDRYVPYAVTIGSNVSSSVAKQIKIEVAYISQQYSNLTIGEHKAHFTNKYGTAYDTCGLAS